MQIGVISDTHGLLRPEAKTLLQECELIIHAGDLGSPDVVPELETIAPVRAIRGNVDRGQWAYIYPKDDVVQISDHYFYVLHDLGELDLSPNVAGFDVVISGHTHRPKIETIDDVLYLNPGSAGPRRFNLPITAAILTISDFEIEAKLHTLEE